MSEEIDLELQRLIDRFGRDEADEDGQIETDAEFLQQVEICQTDSGAPEELLDGEIDAELQRQIELWQRDEAENEPARLEAEARAARELDELLERLLNAPSDL
jgi:hypothetical protein